MWRNKSDLASNRDVQFKSYLTIISTLPWNESSLTNKICRPSNLIKFLSTIVDLSQAINASSASLLVILRKLWFLFFLSALYFWFFWTGLTRVIWFVGLINVGTIQSHGLAWKEKRKEKRKSRDTSNPIPKSITCLSFTFWLVHLRFFIIKFLYT